MMINVALCILFRTITQTNLENQLKYLLKSPALLKTCAISLPSYSFVRVFISVLQVIGLVMLENNLNGILTQFDALFCYPQEIYLGLPLVLSAQTKRSYFRSKTSIYYNSCILYLASSLSQFLIESWIYLLNCWFKELVRFQNCVVFLPKIKGSSWNLFNAYPPLCDSPKNLKNKLTKMILYLFKVADPSYILSSIANLNLSHPFPCLFRVRINPCKSSSALNTSILTSSRSKYAARVMSWSCGLKSRLTFELYCLIFKSRFKAYSRTMGILALACEQTLSQMFDCAKTRMARRTITEFLVIKLQQETYGDFDHSVKMLLQI